jgi:hypothetical protein
VVVDDAVAGEGVGAPDAAEEAVAAEDAAGGIDEERKQFELDGREIYWLAGAAKFGAAEIDFYIAEAVGRALGVLGLGAAPSASTSTS